MSQCIFCKETLIDIEKYTYKGEPYLATYCECPNCSRYVVSTPCIETIEKIPDNMAEHLKECGKANAIFQEERGDDDPKYVCWGTSNCTNALPNCQLRHIQGI